jgi:uncharacterized membrane protein
MFGNGITESLFFLVISLLYYFFKPKKINLFFGYRTYQSKKSQKNWTIANTIASIIFLMGAICSLLLSTCLKLFTSIDSIYGFHTMFSLTIILCIAIVEYKLHFINNEKI